MAGEGNEEMAMGGVTVGNRTGMVGTGAESQAADARFKGEEMAMGGVMVGDQTVMGSTGAEHEAARSFLMTGIGGTGTGVRGDASWSRDGRVSGAGRRRRAARCVESARGSAETGCARGSRGETTGTRVWMHVAGSWNAGGLSTAAREDAGLANGRLARRRSATMATLWPGDGCSASCQIECGWECAGGDADSGRVLCSRVRGPDAGRGGRVQVAGSAEQWCMVFEVLSFSN